MVLIEHRIYSYNKINSCTRILVVLSPAKTVLYCRGCESGRRTNYKAQATEYSLHIAIEPVRIKTSRGSSETRATEARARSLGRRQLLVLFYFFRGEFWTETLSLRITSNARSSRYECCIKQCPLVQTRTQIVQIDNNRRGAILFFLRPYKIAALDFCKPLYNFRFPAIWKTRRTKNLEKSKSRSVKQLDAE